MKAVFLDRDGTLILDPPDERVDSVKEVEFFKDAVRYIANKASVSDVPLVQ